MIFTHEEATPNAFVDEEGFAQVRVTFSEEVPNESLDSFIIELEDNDPDRDNATLDIQLRVVNIFDSDIENNGHLNDDGTISMDVSFKPLVDAFKSDLQTLQTKLNKIVYV